LSVSQDDLFHIFDAFEKHCFLLIILSRKRLLLSKEGRFGVRPAAVRKKGSVAKNPKIEAKFQFHIKEYKKQNIS